MKFKRPPPPDRPVRGRTISIARSLMPNGPVESDLESHWIRIGEAVHLLASVIPTAAYARSAIMQRVITGLIPVSCERLTYQVGGRLTSYDWPGVSARLAEQIGHANGSPFAAFGFNHETGDATWLDLGGEQPAHVLAQGLVVERGAVLAMAGRPNTVNEQLPPAETTPQRVTRAPTIARCAEWLIAGFAADKQNVRSKRDFQDAALSEFTDLSGRSFNTAWNQATKGYPDRRKAGRKGRIDVS